MTLIDSDGRQLDISTAWSEARLAVEWARLLRVSRRTMFRRLAELETRRQGRLVALRLKDIPPAVAAKDLGFTECQFVPSHPR